MAWRNSAILTHFLAAATWPPGQNGYGRTYIYTHTHTHARTHARIAVVAAVAAVVALGPFGNNAFGSDPFGVAIVHRCRVFTHARAESFYQDGPI